MAREFCFCSALSGRSWEVPWVLRSLVMKCELSIVQRHRQGRAAYMNHVVGKYGITRAWSRNTCDGKFRPDRIRALCCFEDPWFPVLPFPPFSSSSSFRTRLTSTCLRGAYVLAKSFENHLEGFVHDQRTSCGSGEEAGGKDGHGEHNFPRRYTCS